MASLRGVLSPGERKPSWPVVAVRGKDMPEAFQHLLRRAWWDPEAVRDELRTDILPHLQEPEAVRVLEATGCLKTGRHSAGVARQ